eukprot:CAMPEP_0183332626 /NCGR_PEP_ID=MMETSP0164_2-20130417/1742_1 /TAXON_ID=221442 /ORGANISM="Coccolithus pelagicus ssp braarudi, Strain PLY182g" /LENGTH=171 /DNA_ID=CAMNT_0025501381 /DNA_START=6 /DNA_END=521 /DNA_ORIENTATION=+
MLQLAQLALAAPLLPAHVVRVAALSRINVTFTHFGYPNEPRFYYMCEGPGSGDFPGSIKTEGKCDDPGDVIPADGGSARYKLCHFFNNSVDSAPPKIQFSLQRVLLQGGNLTYDEPLMLSILLDEYGEWILRMEGKTDYVANYTFSSKSLLTVDLLDVEPFSRVTVLPSLV